MINKNCLLHQNLSVYFKLFPNSFIDIIWLPKFEQSFVISALLLFGGLCYPVIQRQNSHFKVRLNDFVEICTELFGLVCCFSTCTRPIIQVICFNCCLIIAEVDLISSLNYVEIYSLLLSLFFYFQIFKTKKVSIIRNPFFALELKLYSIFLISSKKKTHLKFLLNLSSSFILGWCRP